MGYNREKQRHHCFTEKRSHTIQHCTEQYIIWTHYVSIILVTQNHEDRGEKREPLTTSI